MHKEASDATFHDVFGCDSAVCSLGAHIEGRRRNNNLTNEDSLIEASCNGHAEIVQLFLTNGVNVNARANNGVTPLMCAAVYGHPKVVELLLNKGANVNDEDELGKRHCSRHAVKGFRCGKAASGQGGGCRCGQSLRHYPLMCASYGGHTAIVEMLLEKRVNPDATDATEETALIKASCKGQTDVVKLLLAAGSKYRRPDQNWRNEFAMCFGKTAHRGGEAAYGREEEMIRNIAPMRLQPIILIALRCRTCFTAKS